MNSLHSSSRLPTMAASACLVVALLAVGCKSNTPTPDDAALTRNSQAQISTDASLSGQPVTVSVAKGIASVNGSVLNDAQKTIAARDVAGVSGIKEVINNLTLGGAPLAAANVTAPLPMVAPLPPPVPVLTKLPAIAVPSKPTRAELAREKEQERRAEQQNARQSAPIERSQQPYPPAQAYNPPPVPVVPVQPAFRNVSIPSGTTIPIRVTQTLDSATTQEGDTFSGVVASDVVVDGATVIPAGATVSGHVDTVHEAAHFKGSSLLTVSLATVSRRGDRVAISTEPYTVQGKGRGKNTAEKVGGGAAVGAILGGIFGGGKGAAIGAAAGGGVGAGANAVTKGQQVQIPSETVVRFHLAEPLSVRVRGDQNGNPRNGDNLQPRNQ